MLGRVGAGALLLFAAACVRVEAYACSDESECLTRDGGRCEENGYCSYPDLDCESGRRYSGLAGPVADRCTEPVAGTTDASTTVTSDVDGSTTSSGGLDVPERMTATETGSMEMPGEVVWSFTYDGEAARDDVFWAVEAIDDEHFVVAGHEATNAGARDVLLARYRGPEDEVWHMTRDTDGGNDRVYAMVRGGDGNFYIAGEHSVADSYEAFLASYDGDGAEAWFEPGGCCGAIAIAYGDTNNLLVVGRVNPTTGFARMRKNWNGADFEWDYTITGPEAKISSAGSRGGELFVGGTLDKRAFLGRVDATGVHEFLMVDPQPEQTSDIQHIVATSDAIFVAGLSVTVELGVQAWLARFDLDGALVWERFRGEALVDEWESLAIGPRGELYVVGFDSATEDYDVSVAEWTADGDEVWARTYPEIGAGRDIARDVTVLPSGDLLVVGEVGGPTEYSDAFAARFRP